MLCAALKSSDSCQMKPHIHTAIIIQVISGRVSVGLLSNNGRKNIVGSPRVIKSDRRQPTGLHPACHPIGTYGGKCGSLHAVLSIKFITSLTHHIRVLLFLVYQSHKHHTWQTGHPSKFSNHAACYQQNRFL